MWCTSRRLGEVELWNKTAAAQLDAQLRERRKNFTRRIEAIDRIQDAANTLDERITEINTQDHQLTLLDSKLLELTSHLVDMPGDMRLNLQLLARCQNIRQVPKAKSAWCGRAACAAQLLQCPRCIFVRNRKSMFVQLS